MSGVSWNKNLVGQVGGGKEVMKRKGQGRYRSLAMVFAHVTAFSKNASDVEFAYAYHF